MSAAEMRRLAAEYNKAAKRKPVPEHIDTWWDTYAPRFMPKETWNAIRDEVRDTFEATEHRTLALWKRHCSELAAYLGWRHETDLPTDRASAMTLEAIDAYFVSGYTGTKSSANTVRARLRKLAEHANPTSTMSGPVFTHNAVKPPYSSEEEARIRRGVLRYREGTLRHKLCLIVGLSCGAGLDAADFRPLQNEHIIDHGDIGIEVDVPGGKARTVWVRKSYEELVRIGLEGADPTARVIGGQAENRNSVASILDNATFLGDVPHIEVARLRATWLVWLMQRNLPLPVILEAAGLKGARSLVDLIEHLPAAQPVGGEVLR